MAGRIKAEGQPVPEQAETIYLKPCSGQRGLGTALGHIYKAVTRAQWSARENMGWYTLGEATAKFGPARISVEESTTICKTCSDWLGAQIKAA